MASVVIFGVLVAREKQGNLFAIVFAQATAFGDGTICVLLLGRTGGSGSETRSFC